MSRRLVPGVHSLQAHPVPTHSSVMEQTRYGNFDVEFDAAGGPKLLGQGTFGRTYLARHRFLDTPAALKVINSRFASEPVARERFLSEARSVARLDHKHIARVQDFGEAGGVLFYALEYCGGGTLEQRCAAAGPLPAGEWFTIASQVAGALACCHDAGFIHRDIKPSNLMLAHEDGPLTVKLIDFGLVHSSRKAQPDENDGAGVGSPLYASPEQLREQPLDARSDLFSLGMSLWHMAIGKPPDSGTTRQIIERRLDGRGYESELQEWLPAEVRAILAALLQKDPAGRPQTARALLQMLEAGAAKCSSVGPAASQGVAPPSSLDVVRLERDLEGEFEIIRSEGEQPTGLNYLAKSLVSEGGPVWLHAFHARLWADQPFQKSAVQNIAGVQALASVLLLKPVEVRSYRDYTVVLSAAPAGGPLAAELKSVGKLPFSATAAILGRIASDLDLLASAGLPAADLRPSHIYCERGGLTQNGAAGLRLLPRFASGASVRLAGGASPGLDASATMAPEALTEGDENDSAAGPFARLIYRMTAGRDCVAAASLSVQAYVAVPELSEEGNRFLARVIAGASNPSGCVAMLARLLETEGVSAGDVAGRSAPPSPDTEKPREVAKPAGQGAGISVPPGPLKAAGAVASEAVAKPVTAPKEPQRSAVPAGPSARRSAEGPHAEPAAARAVRAGEPPKPARNRRILLATAVGVVALGVAAVLSLGESSQLPEDAVATFSGELPAHAQFRVNNTVVTPRRSGRVWEVPLGGGLRTPVSVVFQAAGYESVPVEILKKTQLKNAVGIVPKRARGALVFRPDGACDYDHFILELEEALPGEEVAGLPKGERTGDSLREKADSRVELPTGQYSLTLGGSPSVVSGFSPASKLVVKAGGELVFNLPQTYAGRYSSDAEQGQAELRIERDLRSGEFVFVSDGVQRSGKIRRSKLDNKGILNAEFLDSAGGIPSDVTAKLAPDGKSLQLDLISRGANATPQTYMLRRMQTN